MQPLKSLSSIFILVAVCFLATGLADVQVSLALSGDQFSYGTTTKLTLVATVTSDEDLSGSAVSFYLRTASGNQSLGNPQNLGVNPSSANGAPQDISQYVPSLYSFFAVLNPQGAISPDVSLTISQQTPTLSLTPSIVSGALFGDSLTLQTGIQFIGAGGAPTGTFQLLQDGFPLSNLALNSEYTLQLATSGPRTYLLEYSGDRNYTTASVSLDYSVGDNVVFTAFLTPAHYGQGVTYSIQCSSAWLTPVYVSIDTIPDYGSLAVQCGTTPSVFGLYPLPVGTHALNSQYSGKDGHPSISTTTPQIVAPVSSSFSAVFPPTGPELTIDILPNNFASNITLATGTITVKLDGSVIASPSVTDGSATFEIDLALFNNTNAHTVIVSYSGDSNFLPSSQTFQIKGVYLFTTAGPYTESSSDENVTQTSGESIQHGSAPKLFGNWWGILLAGIVGLVLIF